MSFWVQYSNAVHFWSKWEGKRRQQQEQQQSTVYSPRHFIAISVTTSKEIPTPEAFLQATHPSSLSSAPPLSLTVILGRCLVTVVATEFP